MSTDRPLGPQILARTISVPRSIGKSARKWQYHSRSDHHSKVSCWCVVLDMLESCDVFRRDAENGTVSVAVNHLMTGTVNKTLDLVVCRPMPRRAGASRRTFQDLVGAFCIELTDEDRLKLERLPPIPVEGREDVSEVLVALEAKACMTKHSGSIPRLHAEILATGFLAKQAVRSCLTVSYTVINSAPYFITPSEGHKRNLHKQPTDAKSVIDMIVKGIPSNSSFPQLGYDAIGISLIDCRNDGSPVEVVENEPAPTTRDFFHYQRMLQNICSQYRSRFASPSI
jgi:hypothetical protein